MAQAQNNDANKNTPNENDKPSEDCDEKKHESKEEQQENNANIIPQNLEPKLLGTRNKIVIGSFEPSTFHYSFKNQKDPLQIGMFPVFGYLQIPHVGVYGDSYEPMQLKALLELQMSQKLVSNLPNSVKGCVEEIMSQNKIEMNAWDAFAVIHNCPPYKETQHLSMNANNLFNVMYHPWFYNQIQNLSNDQQKEGSLMCGLFEPCNVYEIRNNPKDVKHMVDRGIPFNRLEERSCFLHGFAFSPCNCDVARDAEAGYCSFYMICCTNDYKRACLSYHIFANNNDMDDILKWTFKEIQNVKQLLTAFSNLQWGNIDRNLNALCQHY
eukprot:1025092_1